MGKSYVILKDAPIMDYMTDYVALRTSTEMVG